MDCTTTVSILQETVTMSHHLDSPQARQDIRLDITDLYVFRGQTGTAMIINVCHSFGGDVDEPGFHPEGRYEFKVDLDGDAIEDVSYRVTFSPRDTTGHQPFVLHRLSGSEAADPFAEGTLILDGSTDTISTNSTGVRAWAGLAGDPFWIEPDVLHAIGHAVQDGTRMDLGQWHPDRASNLFTGATVYSLVLELPDAELARAAYDRIGVWAVASLATDGGAWRSINRAGLPMIHPLFTQFNEQLGDELNAGAPRDDFATHGEFAAAKIAGVVDAYRTSDDPGAYGHAVASRLFPNILPYKVGSSACFGFAGWNGRTLTDNAPDVMFSLAANTPIALGLGPESVTALPSGVFPYVPSVNRRG
jgi:hypothetical protein